MPRAGGQHPMDRAYDLISADSHILEPPHLWKQYMPRKFHDKAPRVVPDGEGGEGWQFGPDAPPAPIGIYASDRKSTRLNSSHPSISYAVFCLKKKKKKQNEICQHIQVKLKARD